jgi:anti-anti-sigma factor
VDVKDEPSGPVVMIAGEIDVSAASRLGSAIESALERSSRLVLDLGEVSFMDSTGLNAIASAYRRLGSCPDRIILRKTPDMVRRILLIAGMDRLVTLEPPSRLSA